MKVLVVGGGGREHALVWKIKQSKRVSKVYCAPGNAGISQIAECVDIAVSGACGIDNLLKFALDREIDLTVVGPEVPLTLGIVDRFEENNLRCFGPKKNAAEIEGSKVFSKYLMKKYGIPTAKYEEFSNSKDAKIYVKNAEYPIVIKADGLAAGKGVIIAQNLSQAECAIETIMEEKAFNKAGDKIIIEEFLKGHEVSILAFTDGKTVVPMVSSMDHKRALDNDLGLNTGGMGAISPNPYYSDEIEKNCMKNIFIPTIEAMKNEGRLFKGIIYFGVMLTDNGPKVLEYNCRFGDPETQVVLPRLKTDLVDIIDAVIDGRLNDISIEWSQMSASCVILASGGYPGKFKKGIKINGLDKIPDDVLAFHSGTNINEGNIFTDGGRVLGITSLGNDVCEASNRVYDVLDNINFEGMHYRRDIGRCR